MKPFLERHGITVIALSRDTRAQAAMHRLRDDLPFVLLADPELEVIRAFGLVHEKGVPFVTFTVLGIPLGWPTGRVQAMAIPTTLLVDEAGVVRWVDQATDYRLRGDEARIRAAVLSVFGEPGHPAPEA